ncbi:hypothetical protein AN697_12025 [Enterobacter cloacae subsp. cloacae]|nr:hypothetical protein AN697_12025 [Enterobacter cloacae subsp. cloacae]
MAKMPTVLGEGHSAKFFAQYKDSTGRYLPCYQFPKREACLIVMVIISISAPFLPPTLFVQVFLKLIHDFLCGLVVAYRKLAVLLMFPIDHPQKRQRVSVGQ